MIYFDNAASTWPKPKEVSEAMKLSIDLYGANPGRGTHQLAIEAEKTIFEARRQLAQLFQVRDPNNIFFFANATEAINQAIKGLLEPGDHVITTSWEHHAVVRPLEELKRKQNIKVTYIEPSPEGNTCPHKVSQAILPETKLIVTIHGSNVTGAITPVEEIGALAKKHGIPYLVDAAQTAGVIPIDVEQLNIDLLAFPGHKGLMGPQGTGGLYVRPELELTPILQGGTGSQSESLEQPVQRPWGYESGTPNTPGIAGLLEGIRFIQTKGIESIYEREIALTKAIKEGLLKIEGITLYGPQKVTLPLLSFNINGLDPQEVAIILDQEYNIAVRAGYHCAYMAHQSLGTAEQGTVRVSPGYFNQREEVDQFLIAIQEIVQAFGE